MLSIGLDFPTWQEAVEAAIATDALSVTGEIRGGQLIQFEDPSGAQLNILAVEPFATYIGYKALTQTFGHVSMLNDVLAHIEIIDPFGTPMAEITANLAQGPLLADLEQQQWQQLGVTALGLQVARYDSPEAYEAEMGQPAASIESDGAEIVATGSAQTPTAGARFAARVLEAVEMTNALTGQKFIHCVMDGAFPFDLCLPASFGGAPAKNTVLAGTAMLVASVQLPTGGCGSGSGGCGCGSGGCGSH